MDRYEIFPKSAFISEYTGSHNDIIIKKSLGRSLALPHRDRRWGYDLEMVKKDGQYGDIIPLLLATTPTELITFSQIEKYKIEKEGRAVKIYGQTYRKISKKDHDICLIELFKDNDIIRNTAKKERYGHISSVESPSFQSLCSLIRRRKTRDDIKDGYYEIIDDLENRTNHQNIGKIENLSDLDCFMKKAMRSLNMILIEDPEKLSDCEEENLSLFGFFRRIMVSLRLLSRGGCLIVKTPYGYTEVFIELLFLLSIHFKKTVCYRPLAIAPTSSEKYFIFKDFNGIDDQHYSVLRSIFSSWITGKNTCCSSGYITKIIDFGGIPRSFEKWIRRANEDIIDIMVSKFCQIDDILCSNKNQRNLVKKMLDENIIFCKEWCYTHGIELDPSYGEIGTITEGRSIASYFPQEYDININDLVISEEGKYSISRPRDADAITKIIIKSLIDKYRIERLVITEATANVGGNVLNFAKQFKHVNAVEISSFQMKILRKNCMTYKRNNISFYNENYADICLRLKQDIIFIDPPWGGVNYKDQKKIELYLSGIPLGDIVSRLENKARLIVLKVPINYNFQSLLTNIDSRAMAIYKIRNYLIVTIRLQI